jgi:hypothetical protein
LRGYLGEKGLRPQFTGNTPGVSFHVLDTAWNHRLMRTWRSEDFKRYGREQMEKEAERRAREYAEDLNAGRTPRQPRARYNERARYASR